MLDEMRRDGLKEDGGEGVIGSNPRQLNAWPLRRCGTRCATFRAVTVVQFAVIVVLLALAPPGTSAAPIRVAFAGVFDRVDGGGSPSLLPEEIQLGTSFSGEYVFDSAPVGPAVEVSFQDSAWLYPVDPTSSITLRVDDLVLETVPTDVLVFDDLSDARDRTRTTDVWAARLAEVPAYTSANEYLVIGIAFTDDGGTAILDPTSYFVNDSLTPWTTSAELGILAERASQYESATGRLTSLMIVPEPSHALLVGIGLAILGTARPIQRAH